MKKLHPILPILFLIFHTQVAYSYELKCERNIGESILLKQAPTGAARVNKHILEVKYSAGSKRFVDEPPHEKLDGTHWKYCGYDKKVRIHLIHKQIFGRFTGVILFEDTGWTFLAGHSVLIDPMMKYVLGIEQESGMDGELWSLFDISGKKLWSGYAGITKKADIDGRAYDAVYAQFENPRLDNASSFIADFVCSDGTRKGIVTLTHGKDWKWLPEYQCK